MSILKELKEMITARGGNAGSANTVAQAVDVLTDLGGGGSSGGGNYVVTVAMTSWTTGTTNNAINEITNAFLSHKTVCVDIKDQTGALLNTLMMASFVDTGEGIKMASVILPDPSSDLMRVTAFTIDQNGNVGLKQINLNSV